MCKKNQFIILENFLELIFIDFGMLLNNAEEQIKLEFNPESGII